LIPREGLSNKEDGGGKGKEEEEGNVLLSRWRKTLNLSAFDRAVERRMTFPARNGPAAEKKEGKSGNYSRPKRVDGEKEVVDHGPLARFPPERSG